jgi:hypothetical protein
MTVFIISKDRQLEISDAYFMALVFISGYMSTKLVMKMMERRRNKKEKTNLLFRGGAFELIEAETANMIVTCLKEEVTYIVKDRKLIKLIYRLAKRDFKLQSLTITPHLTRLLALKLVSKNTPILMRVQNLLLFSGNSVRFLVRSGSALTLSTIATMTSILPFAVFVVVATFTETDNCGFQLDRYFQEIKPQDNGAIMLYAPQPTGNFIITGKNSARRVEIFVPDQTQLEPNQIVKKVNGQKTISRVYRKTTKKAKMVTFSEFIKKDAILKPVGELKTPNIPTKDYPFTPERIKSNI